MAQAINTEHDFGRSDVFAFDPRDVVVEWSKNLSRGGVEPTVDDDLVALAKDMMPKKGPGDAEDGTSGQINPVLVRLLKDRRPELVGGFRRTRAALYLVESGLCPDFRLKALVVKMSDGEAALANMAENLHRSNPEPIQMAHAIRSLHEDYGMTLAAIAGRLKRSTDYVSKLLELVELPAAIQASVAAGDTPINAALEIAKLPAPEQIKTFNEAKDSNGKVKAKEVKKVAQAKRDAAIDAKAEAVAQAEQDGAQAAKDIVAADKAKAPAIKAQGRSLNDLTTFLRDREKLDDGKSQEVAGMLLDFVQGEVTKKQLLAAWEKAFA